MVLLLYCYTSIFGFVCVYACIYYESYWSSDKGRVHYRLRVRGKGVVIVYKNENNVKFSCVKLSVYM